MEDRYLCNEESYNRLLNDYAKHKSLFIAFDYDNTVFDYHNVGDTFPKLEDILIRSKKCGMKLVLFTANEGGNLDKIIASCKEKGYEPDFVNESPVTKTRKPYYNILLDDRAGLSSAYEVLLRLIEAIEYSESIKEVNELATQLIDEEILSDLRKVKAEQDKNL